MRTRRRIEFERFMKREAWRADELAIQLGMSTEVCRRYLRMYKNFGLLERVKFGVYAYYAVRRFLQPPDGFYTCLQCGGQVAVYIRECSCVFQFCERCDFELYDYCKRHASTRLSKDMEVKHHERGK